MHTCPGQSCNNGEKQAHHEDTPNDALDANDKVRGKPQRLQVLLFNHVLRLRAHAATCCKYQIPNTKYQIPNTKYQTPNTKYQIPNTNTKYKIYL